MTTYTEWRDFVIYMWNPDLGESHEARFAVDKARPYDAGAIENIGNIVTLEQVCYLVRLPDETMVPDEFELMQVGEYGSVMIWTKYRVWCVRREHGNGSMRERLLFLERNPNTMKINIG